MDELLHWDFNPGISFAYQIQRRYGCTVHFSPSRDIKEFFLVASFSSASFHLSEESVAIALQCCLGGHPQGFRVHKLNNRSFRFSVSNNKVGHFIHSLKDRVWPDFICHFHLYNGQFNKLLKYESDWHADKELQDLTARSPIAIKCNLDFLKTGSFKDPSSIKESSKFLLTQIAAMDFSNKHAGEASSSVVQNSNVGSSVSRIERNSCSGMVNGPLMAQFSQASALNDINDNCLHLGAFRFPITAVYPCPPQCFLSSALKYAPPCTVWPPALSLQHQRDLGNAGYDHDEIQLLAKFWGVLCAKCLQWGHPKIDCPAKVICLKCFGPGHKYADCTKISEIKLTEMASRDNKLQGSSESLPTGNHINQNNHYDLTTTQNQRHHSMQLLWTLWTRGYILPQESLGPEVEMDAESQYYPCLLAFFFATYQSS